MLSILIPTYNHSVKRLVNVLLKQFNNENISYEILVADDASTDETIVLENKLVVKHECVSYFRNITNKGRTATRQLLAEKAHYDKLLFLDADVLPKSNQFTKTLLVNIGKADLVFGGISYQENMPSSEYLLHWHYGKNREAKTVPQREKQPYLSVNSGCLYISKQLFLRVNAQMMTNSYGLDNYFKQLLKVYKVTIKHIDNPVIHLGLEQTDIFIGKMLKSVETTYELEQDNLMRDDVRPLQKAYNILRQWNLLSVFGYTFELLKSRIMKNLHSKKPSLRYFDMLRLHHYINLKD